MHRLRDAVPGIKARTDCRDLARQLGLPRRWIPFPHSSGCRHTSVSAGRSTNPTPHH